jgi:hypothetical protein
VRKYDVETWIEVTQDKGMIVIYSFRYHGDPGTESVDTILLLHSQSHLIVCHYLCSNLHGRDRHGETNVEVK